MTGAARRPAEPPTVVTPELLAAYDRPGPRYTSYPTAVDFHDGFGPDDYAERLADAAGRPDDPLSLYVHLPFCEQRCSFCACHVVVTGRASVADAYLGRVVAEARTTAAQLGERRVLQQYHWGGGTPTYFPPEVLAELHHALLSEFELAPGAEVALEVDPRVTTPEHLAVLRELGFNRLSMGVQDADQTVQRLIGRNQTWEQTADLFDTARRLGYGSVNIDLIYGLPGQTEQSFSRSLDLVAALRPDRMAVYSFALVPWMRPNQKRIDADLLPDRDQKFGLLSMAIARLSEAGYRQIGMDHFALPNDELTIAHEQRTLSRNFMGYTTKRGTEIVGLGSSAISDVADAYSQNHRHRPRSGRSAAALRDHRADVQRTAAGRRGDRSLRGRRGRSLRPRVRGVAGSGRIGRGRDGANRRWRHRSHRDGASVHPQRGDGVRRPTRHGPR